MLVRALPSQPWLHPSTIPEIRQENQPEQKPCEGDRQQGLHTFTGAHKAGGGPIWPFRGTNMISSRLIAASVWLTTKLANALFPIDPYTVEHLSNLSKAI
jgi:hypothetical protein